MKCVKHLKSFIPSKAPIVLTIGNFDGVHLGHLHVISHAINHAQQIEGQTVLLTFLNHPSEVLQPHKPVKYLCTPTHKHQLLSQVKINTLVELPFTDTFSKQTAKDFLLTLRNSIPYTHLVLGHDATIGKDRHGDKKEIHKIAKEIGFTVDYVDPLSLNDVTLSSSKIRHCISEGDFTLANTMLGRPYSLLGKVTPGNRIGRELGYPTANIDISALCLPPYGVYAVKIKTDEGLFDGIANLGIAPTIRTDTKPVLEAFLFETPDSLENREIEVVFEEFIREERSFSSIEALKAQIKEDVELCKFKKRSQQADFLN